MDFGLTSAFNNAVNRYGMAAALVGVGLLVAIYLAMRYSLGRIEAARAAENARLEQERQAEAAKLEAERQERQARIAKDQSLVRELEEARKQNLKIMENHLEHDRQEREVLTKALTETASSLRSVAEGLREVADGFQDSRREASERAKALHERLNAIHLDVRTGSPRSA